MPLRGRHSKRFKKEQAAQPSPPSPPIGPRRAALQRRRRERKIKSAALSMAGIGAVLIVVAAGIWMVTDDRPPGDEGTAPSTSAPAEDPVTTTLVYGTREQGGPALWLTLLSHDDRTGRSSINYIPAHVAVEVPGRGLHALGDTLTTGDAALLVISAENLLGLDVDRHIELSEGDARILFDALGPLSVDVPTEVRVRAGRSSARVIFAPGQQRLPPEFLVDLLYTVGLDSDDEEMGSRHLAFWQALLAEFEDDPAELGAAVRRAGPAVEESGVDAVEHAAFFRAVAAAPEDQRILGSVPVTQVSVGGSELYSVDEDELMVFLEESIGSLPAAPDEIRVQVLNGNGEPGIGQEVATRLVGHGFKVVVSSNARRFNYQKTLIITYDDTPEAEQAAEQAKELIGLGQVQVSAQSQGIVDLTIVVGKDFLRTL